MPRKQAHRQIHKLAKYALGLTFGGIGAGFLTRSLLKKVFQANIYQLMTNVYDKNLWEFVSAATKVGLQTIEETNLRAEYGVPLMRPLGSPRKFPSLDNLMFDIAQLNRLPIGLDVPIEMKTLLGPKAKKPLVIGTPIMVAGMAYGLALSEKAKVGLALGASAADTATNTGEGPFLESERKAAKHYILQYNRATWSKSPEILQQADMIEIQLGQGSIGGIGHVMDSRDIEPILRQRMGLAVNQDAVTHARQPGISQPEDLRLIVEHIRANTQGVPVGVKMGAGKFLEQDMDIALSAGVDVIAIDGAEAGSKGSPPILEDDFGLPTLFALCRAIDHLEELGVKNQVSLVISGGLATPGDFLKAIALGADAVYIGAAALFAMTHTQVLKALPYEPPTQVVWHDGKFTKKFNPQEGGKNLGNFINSCTAEMAEGIRALGKLSVHQLDRTDLFALDQTTAELARVPLASQKP